MPLKDYLEVVEPLAPVYKGKAYPLPPVGAKAAVRILEHINPNHDTVLTGTEVEQILLGDQAAVMEADDVPQDFVVRAIFTAIADVSHGRAAAEEIWDRGADPKALVAWVGEQGFTLSKASEAATVTPSPASTSSTTTSRPNSKPSAKAATPRSSGSRSSSSGRSSKAASTPSTASTS